MIKKLYQNLWAKVEIEYLPLVQKQNSFSSFLFFCILLFLPTQLGLHFWPSFTVVNGQRIDYLSPTLYITDCFILLLLAVNLKKIITATIKTSLIFLPVVLLGIGVVFSVNFWAGIYGLTKLVEFSFLGWYISQHEKTTISFLQLAVPIGVVTETLLAWLQYIFQHSMGGVWYLLGERSFTAETPGIANASLSGHLLLRPYATFSHPNVLAGYLLVALIFLLVFPFGKNKLTKGIYGGVIVLSFIGIVLSMSRTIILLAIPLGLFLLLGKRKIHKLGILLCLCIGLLSIAFLVPRFAAFSFADESVVLREALIKESWIMFVSHPLFGVGIQSFYNQLSLLSVRIELQPVHNIFLLILSETGISGFLVSLYFLLKTVKHVLKHDFESHLGKNIRKFSLISIFILLSVGLVDHYFLTLQQGQLLTTLLFGLAWSNPRHATIEA